MEGPMAALDAVAEASECACCGLSKNAEIDEISMDGVLVGAEPCEDRRVHNDGDP